MKRIHKIIMLSVNRPMVYSHLNIYTSSQHVHVILYKFTSFPLFGS